MSPPRPRRGSGLPRPEHAAPQVPADRPLPDGSPADRRSTAADQSTAPLQPAQVPAAPQVPAALQVPAAQTSADVRTNIALAFGRTVRAARRACGISQESLATRAQLDRTYPSLLERGRRTPTLGSLFAISRALNVHPSALLTDAWLAYQSGRHSAPPYDPPKRRRLAER